MVTLVLSKELHLLFSQCDDGFICQRIIIPRIPCSRRSVAWNIIGGILLLKYPMCKADGGLYESFLYGVYELPVCFNRNQINNHDDNFCCLKLYTYTHQENGIHCYHLHMGIIHQV